MKIKITIRYYFTPISMDIIKRQAITSAGKDVKKLEFIY